MQNYKVFFNNNTLYIAKKQPLNVYFNTKIVNPTINEIKTIIKELLEIKSELNYLIISDNLEQVWAIFKSLFKIHKAAGGVIFNKKKQTLFIERNGLWDLPKGHMENNESEEETAIREVMEECGIDRPDIIDKICYTYHIYKLDNNLIFKQTAWFLMFYDGSSVCTPQTEEGITRVVWFDDADRLNVFSNTYLSIKQVVKSTDNLLGTTDLF